MPVTMPNRFPMQGAQPSSNRFQLSPSRMSSQRFRMIPRSGTQTVKAQGVLEQTEQGEQAKQTWQARLDKALLGLDVEPQERLNLLQEAFNDPVLPGDLQAAVTIIQEKGFGQGHPEAIEKLWPKGTMARADLEGLTALRKQVPEVISDVQKQAQESPSSFFPSFSSTGGSDGAATAATLPDISSVFSSLAALATDPKKQEEFAEEAKDLLRSTPKGLETPQYEVVRVIDGPLFLGSPEPIEVRAYEEFTVARTSMEGAGFTSRSGATGFNTLASYLFGSNEEKQAMAMTMPVEMTTSTNNSQGSMAFVLPKQYAGAPPAPLANSSVTIDKVPARLVAAKTFPGIVTDEEVQRQKTALLDAIAADGSLMPADESQVIVLQYNSPLTLPWRRRNEVAVIVSEKPQWTTNSTAGQPEEVAAEVVER